MSLGKATGFADEVSKQMGSLLVPYQRLTLIVGLAIAYALIDIAEELRGRRGEFLGDALVAREDFARTQVDFSASARQELDRLAGEAVDEFVRLGEDDDV